MSSHQYKKSRCGDKTVLRPSSLHNGISHTSEMTSLYWINPQVGWPDWVRAIPGYRYTYLEPTQQTHYPKMTSFLRQNDVITSEWRCFYVITTLLLRHVFGGNFLHAACQLSPVICCYKWAVLSKWCVNFSLYWTEIFENKRKHCNPLDCTDNCELFLFIEGMYWVGGAWVLH